MTKADGGRIGWIWLEPSIWRGFCWGSFGDVRVGFSGSGVVVDASFFEDEGSSKGFVWAGDGSCSDWKSARGLTCLSSCYAGSWRQIPARSFLVLNRWRLWLPTIVVGGVTSSSDMDLAECGWSTMKWLLLSVDSSCGWSLVVVHSYGDGLLLLILLMVALIEASVVAGFLGTWLLFMPTHLWRSCSAQASDWWRWKWRWWVNERRWSMVNRLQVYCGCGVRWVLNRGSVYGFFLWFFDIDPPFAWLGWSLLREGMKLFGEWNFLEEKFVRGREVTKHERGERGRRKEWWKIRVAGIFFYVFVWFFLFFLSFHFILFCWIFKMTVQNGVSTITIMQIFKFMIGRY